MSSIEFLSPRLRGERFDDGFIPLEFLADLAVLQEMVVEVARWRYMEANPDRQRSPRGFSDSVALKLTRVDSGSAVPVINLASTQRGLDGVPVPYQNFFEEAREYIIDAIATEEANTQQFPNGHLPTRYLAYFNRIGQSLRNDESLELSSPRRVTPARLTKETRQRLLQRSSVSTFRQEVTLRGTIPEADQSRMTFELQPAYGLKVPGPIPDQYYQTIVDAFGGYRENVKVLVQGVGRFDRQGRISDLESVSRVSLLDPMDIPARLDEFRSMKDGWLEGKGVAPSRLGLDWLSASFESHFPDDLPLPYVFPTPEGGIEAEWQLGTHSAIFGIDINTRRGDWLQFDRRQSDEEHSKELNLNEDGDWEWMTGEIRRLANSSQ